MINNLTTWGVVGLVACGGGNAHRATLKHGQDLATATARVLTDVHIDDQASVALRSAHQNDSLHLQRIEESLDQAKKRDFGHDNWKLFAPCLKDALGRLERALTQAGQSVPLHLEDATALAWTGNRPCMQDENAQLQTMERELDEAEITKRRR